MALPLRSGGRIQTRGRWKVRVAPGIWELEHRVVMERVLGRPLARGECVVHRNGNALDNRPENLKLVMRPKPSLWRDCLCGCGMRVRTRRAGRYRAKGYVQGHNSRVRKRRKGYRLKLVVRKKAT